MSTRLTADAKKSRDNDWASQIAASDLFVAPTTSFKLLHGRVIPLHGLRRAATSSSKSAQLQNRQTSNEEIAARRGGKARSAAHDFETCPITQGQYRDEGTGRVLRDRAESSPPPGGPLSGPSSDWAEQSPPLRLNSPAERDRECERRGFSEPRTPGAWGEL